MHADYTQLFLCLLVCQQECIIRVYFMFVFNKRNERQFSGHRPCNAATHGCDLPAEKWDNRGRGKTAGMVLCLRQNLGSKSG